jgi:hypothetical protein
MSYMQALAVGWSIYWRQAVWTACVLMVTIPIFLLARQNPDRARIYVACALLILAVFAGLFPRTILRVLRIRYSDFRLVPCRAEERSATVRYWEAAALSTVVNLVPAPAAPVLLLYVGSVPVLGAFGVVLFPVLVGMPLAGWLLTGVRIFGLQIEIAEAA